MMGKYRKVVAIEAEQYDGSLSMGNKYHLEDVVLNVVPTPNGPEEIDGVAIKTKEGLLTVGKGDWIATGVNGEHWPIADEIFKKTYAELPVISRKLSEYIELYMSKGYGLTAALCDCTDEDCPDDISDIKLARAWLDGYQVEEDVN